MSGDGDLVYGRWLVQRWDSEIPSVVESGALYQEKGRIIAVGTFDELRKKYPGAKAVGNASYLVVPGFVNAHSHGKGLTTYQMGQPDEPLETRIVEIFHRPEWGGQSSNAPAGKGYDPYLDTLYACAKQLAAGITTTLHSHGYFNGGVDSYAANTRKVVQGYRDSGMRCAFTLGIRDRFTFTFHEDKDFVALLPPQIRAGIDKKMMQCDMTFPQFYDLLSSLANDFPDIKFQLGPWNPVFCSDSLLETLADVSKRCGWRVQTHLVETRYQAEYAKKAYGKSWVKRLNGIGMLSQRFSGAHCVWVDDDDIELMQQSGMQVVHNPSSNLRLHSGIAPVRRFLRAGVPVAFGLDSLGMNDDDDILQDLRLAQLIHSDFNIDSQPIAANTMLAMATETGSVVTGFEGIGAIIEGNFADITLLSISDMEGTPSGHPVADLLLKRAKAVHVRTVMVDGEILIEDGKWMVPSPAHRLEELAAAASPKKAVTPHLLKLKAIVREYLRGR